MCSSDLVVWTTTPWTLPANVAAAVDPDAEYAAVRTSQGLDWVMASCVADLFGEDAKFDAYKLIQGYGNKSVELDHALWDLSRVALKTPAVAAAIAPGVTRVENNLRIKPHGA